LCPPDQLRDLRGGGDQLWKALHSSDGEPPLHGCTKLEQPNVLARPQLLGRSRPGFHLDFNNPSEFVPVTEFISESEVYTRPVDEEFRFVPETDNVDSEWPVLSDPVHLPEQLRVLCLRKNLTQFLGNPRFTNGQFDFYPLDLASIIPVLALNLQPGDTLLDLCAAPGGKSIAALQTMMLSRLLCVDNSESRLERLQQSLNAYGPASGNGLKIDAIHESQLSHYMRDEMGQTTDAGDAESLFDKVLVDVPCSTDRHAICSDSGSVFSRGRMKARLALTTTQNLLLRRAMNVCRPGGTVVYSTCTLSPAQNQFLVQSCLQQVNQTDGGMRYAVVDLRPLARLFQRAESVLKLRSVPMYVSDHVDASPIGLLIVPTVAANYGPAFVTKLRRLS
uniref:NOL1/NOP2/Sun domain family member 4 n=1 Tax=Echinostoma caproni TaxID=27848 RepID=A0A183B249_9TREM